MLTKLKIPLTYLMTALEVFANSAECKNANIAKSVLTVPLEMNKNNEVCNLEM